MAQLPPQEWLRPSDVIKALGISKGKFYQLERDGAFPVSRPQGKGRLCFVRHSDIEAFLKNGYPKSA
jgi:predicted DNA-binding transcriptional regulator AlpA